MANGETAVRRILRFGQSITGEDIPSVPSRYRDPNGMFGKLVGARLRSTNGEVWLRLRQRELLRPLRAEARTIALNAEQAPAPSPDALELLPGMRLYCHDGLVGRLVGLTIDAQAGVVSELLTRVRTQAMVGVESLGQPSAALLPAQGQSLLLPPAWIQATKPERSAPLRGPGLALFLDASAEQVAAGATLRADAEVEAAIWSILGGNPALAPYLGGLRVSVRDGDVLVSGVVPSIRHRASAEQDIWHVPGVFAVRNNLTVGA